MKEVSTNVNSLQAAPIVHTLATASLQPLTEPERWLHFPLESWPEVAQALVQEGYDWPALVSLATTVVEWEEKTYKVKNWDQILQLVTELVSQTKTDHEWPYWDIVCAIAVRKMYVCRKIDPEHYASTGTGLASTMNGLWNSSRYLTEAQETKGSKLIWRGMGLSELVGFQDIEAEMAPIIAEAEKLGPPIPFGLAACDIILEELY